ncbi:hypothetical protein SAMN05421503_1384 [Terribacillus aidingensis]|uniref:GIY-YIG domain-containing protein n=1 Tax=Terribacillus aidingensis TaxID=586416 RepID=A0A285NLP5_9BACI|nr:hypothetical protein [Terribacillus aidingensis]SNZ09843.1 hypothetical protein SAMN05421503_1384 [Terribacillus aidingensis]
MSNTIFSLSMIEAKNILNQVGETLKKDLFIPFFKSIKDEYRLGVIQEKTPKIFAKKINTIDDLNEFPSTSAGLYVILTDYKKGYVENPCDLKIKELENVKAIYRGQASDVRLRLKSHLFHELYEQERIKDINNGNIRHDNYIVCMKLVDRKEEGINLHRDKELKKANWYVIYHGLRESNRYIRENAEEAFDLVFHKPICSNEKVKVVAQLK